MKRIIMFSVILMAIALTVTGVVREAQKDATLDITSGLSVLANQNGMAKYALTGKKIVFSADDFEKNLNLSEISSITVTSVPAVSDGCLCVGDVVVNAGQTVSGDNLDLLNFRPSSESVRQTVFKFKPAGFEYEIECSLYFLTRENSAPTLAHEDEKIFSVSTHQTVTVYGKVSAYDDDGDELRYEIVTYAKNGVIELDGKSGEYSYTPSGLYFGKDSFEYVAVDKYGNYSSARTVNLTVERLKTDTVYADMDKHPALHASLTMTENNIMSGTTIGDSTFFMPDKSVSRIDFLVMLMNAIGVNDIPTIADTGFDDDSEIPASMKGYVYRARQMGIITGAVNGDGEYFFYPNKDITRAEASLIVYNLVEGKVPTVKPIFSDRADIPAWAHDAIYTLADMGILSATDGSIAPSASLTRAQTAQMLYALMSEMKK
ncbi:MAG: S-layer homology domain-containing protein [Eubacteriales bacterium]